MGKEEAPVNMKKSIRNFLIGFILISLLTFYLSCEDDDILEDPRQEWVCNYDFENFQENSSLNVYCDQDLQGDTIYIPSNFTLNYDGGKLTNGTLIALGNMLISPELLNKSLKLEGSIKLDYQTHTLVPENWGIVQGLVTDEVALVNRQNLNELIELIVRLRGNRLMIGELDAYFQVRSQTPTGDWTPTKEYSYSQSIRIPSNFTLEMSDNTHIRTQPNDTPHYWLLSSFSTDNIQILGGNLWGDRDEHIYTQNTGADTHEYGMVTCFVGVHNGLVNGTNLRDGTGDGVITRNISLRRPSDGALVDGNRTCENFTISNGVIDNNRRNNLSPVDGDGIIIENNIISNSGQFSNGIDGTLPKSGIDLESYRIRLSDGTLQEWQRIENVIIRGNTFTNSANADLILFTTNNVQVYENNFSRTLTNTSAFDVIIRDNVFFADKGLNDVAIKCRSLIVEQTGEQLNYNWEVYNNEISGDWQYGISMSGDNHKIHHNTITNALRGITFGSLKNSVIHDNTVISNRPLSDGLQNFGSAVAIGGVIVTNDYYDVTSYGLKLRGMDGSAGELYIFGTTFKGGNQDVSINYSNDVTLANCTFNTITILDSFNINY